jgi:hypothetical protein
MKITIYYDNNSIPEKEVFEDVNWTWTEEEFFGIKIKDETMIREIKIKTDLINRIECETKLEPGE